jgi:hypothetical protein
VEGEELEEDIQEEEIEGEAIGEYEMIGQAYEEETFEE